MTQASTANNNQEQQQTERDLVGQYLNQIGSTPLLNAEDEVRLSKRIEAGLYAEELLRQAEAGERPMDAGERRDLRTVAREGREAKDEMLRANLRLVVSLAKKYLRRGLSFGDVIQEGNLGLIRAVEKFDYAKGYKFSTYATWWIRQAITRGLADQSRTVRLPVHMVEQVNKLDRVERTLELRLEREPTVEELAEAAELSQEKVVELQRASREAVSLDVPVGSDGETSVGDLVEDMEAPRATDIVEQQAFSEELHALLGVLPEREGTVLALRYGLHDGHQHTLNDIAKRMELSRERVRQIERHALARLREPQHRDPLIAWAS